jgi:hypothetical protein
LRNFSILCFDQNFQFEKLKTTFIRVEFVKLGLYHVQLMRYYEEVMAQSARNYAFTGDKKWEMRYRSVEPLADKLLKDAIENADDEIRPFFATMDNANTNMVKMEYHSIDLVNQEKKEKAIDILEGEEYQKERRILAGGLEGFVSKVEGGNQGLMLFQT